MDLIVDELGEVVVNNVHVGAGAQASRRGAAMEGAARLARRRQGQPRQARLPDRRRAVGPRRRRACTCASRWTAKVVTDVDQPVLMVAVGNGASVGGGTELTPDADPEDGQVDVMISHAVGARGQARLRLPPAARGAPPSATTCSYLRGATVTISGEAFWMQRGRRDQRPGAAPDLARRAGGVLRFQQLDREQCCAD